MNKTIACFTKSCIFQLVTATTSEEKLENQGGLIQFRIPLEGALGGDPSVLIHFLKTLGGGEGLVGGRRGRRRPMGLEVLLQLEAGLFVPKVDLQREKLGLAFRNLVAIQTIPRHQGMIGLGQLIHQTQGLIAVEKNGQGSASIVEPKSLADGNGGSSRLGSGGFFSRAGRKVGRLGQLNVTVGQPEGGRG
jgi:hypothetical protein